MKHILAIDIGTTSAKVLVVSQKGEVVASAQQYYPTQNPEPDFSEQDPEAIYQAVRKIIRQAADEVKGQVDGVSFSSAMHSLLAVDVKGNVLLPMIIWADLRSRKEALNMDPGLKQKIYEETGTPVHPMSPFCKLLWLKKHRPELFKPETRFIGIKEYIWFRLFNKFEVDHSVASASGLLNTVTREWSTLALDSIGMDRKLLSVPCSIYKTENAHPQVSTALGLPASTTWVMGGSDGCLANLGSSAMDSDSMSLTIGTSGAVRKAVKKNVPDATGRTFNYLLDEETLITGGATNNGAILVQWFSENFLKEKVHVKDFGERAATIPAGSEGLIFLPYVLGERAPVWDPDATGVFFGVRKQHTVEHFMRAVLEGVGYALLSIAESVEKNSGTFKTIFASGGFIKSDHWVQIVADIFGKEVCVRGKDDASALGAALVGFKGIGSETGFQFPTERTFNPNLVNHKRYKEYFSVYKNMYPHLIGDFDDLNKIA